MNNLIRFLRSLLGFTSSKPIDIPLLQGPIARYPALISTTLLMAMATVLGVVILAAYWMVLPFFVRMLLLVAVISMPITWAQSVWNHVRFRREVARMGREVMETEPFRMAAVSIYSGASSVFGIALGLFMAILLIMGHYDRQPWQDKAKAWLTTNASVAPTSAQDAQPPTASGTRVFPAKLKHRVQPVYPKDAKIMGIEGTVRLSAIIEKDGSVDHIEYVSGPKELADAAIAAVRQWVYEPTIWNGRIVTVKTKIDIVFKLNN